MNTERPEEFVEEAAADAVHSDKRNNLEAVVSYAVSG